MATVCIYHGSYECDLETGDLLSEAGKCGIPDPSREPGFRRAADRSSAHDGACQEDRRDHSAAASGKCDLCYAKLEIACEDGEVSVSASIDPAGEFMMRNRTGHTSRAGQRVQQWLDEKAGSLEEDIPPAVPNTMALGLRSSRFL